MFPSILFIITQIEINLEKKNTPLPHFLNSKPNSSSLVSIVRIITAFSVAKPLEVILGHEQSIILLKYENTCKTEAKGPNSR